MKQILKLEGRTELMEEHPMRLKIITQWNFKNINHVTLPLEILKG